MASIICWQFSGLPCSPSTRAAASRALVFLTFSFFALGFFVALVGLGLWDAAAVRVGAFVAAGMPLASGGGWSLRGLPFVVFLLAAMSGLPKGGKLRIAPRGAIKGGGGVPAAPNHP